MSSGEPRPHRDMLDLALEVVALLAESCSRIAIAGSLRRGKAMVGDIEIVCQPIWKDLPSAKSKLFLINQNAAHWTCDGLRQAGVLEPRPNMKGNPQSWGEQQKWFTYKGAHVDLYSVLPGYSWGRELLIRTGPGDANQVLVTREGVRNREGNLGVLPEPFKFRDREIWCGEGHIPTPEESDVFAVLGMPYIAPPLRSVAVYQRWAGRRGGDLPKGLRRPDGSWPQGWVGAPDYGGDVWIGGQPYVLRFVKVKEPVQGVA